ncbi:hypothetical protein M011DRAFT_32053 [Sporormia fimetaria CBS 119925]|uniref:Uncharacterized protein n=1 Tax=Sporormia fimetaria CBS 119925 TaxID=1340428 RepID=A0A6A6VEH1_9PLEO|nr:hypothetical protein M011DRAFT_32053 [Sporormia fimetaria CBS 119925]
MAPLTTPKHELSLTLLFPSSPSPSRHPRAFLSQPLTVPLFLNFPSSRTPSPFPLLFLVQHCPFAASNTYQKLSSTHRIPTVHERTSTQTHHPKPTISAVLSLTSLTNGSSSPKGRGRSPPPASPSGPSTQLTQPNSPLLAPSPLSAQTARQDPSLSHFTKQSPNTPEMKSAQPSPPASPNLNPQPHCPTHTLPLPLHPHPPPHPQSPHPTTTTTTPTICPTCLTNFQQLPSRKRRCTETLTEFPRLLEYESDPSEREQEDAVSVSSEQEGGREEADRKRSLSSASSRSEGRWCGVGLGYVKVRRMFGFGWSGKEGRL